VAKLSAVAAGFDHHCANPIGIEALMQLMHRHEVGEEARALGGIANEMASLAGLSRLDILDTEAEAVHDEITRLASEMAGAPIALVSLIDDSRQ
jgi:hypothetical protein